MGQPWEYDPETWAGIPGPTLASFTASPALIIAEPIALEAEAEAQTQAEPEIVAAVDVPADCPTCWAMVRATLLAEHVAAMHPDIAVCPPVEAVPDVG